MNEQQLFHWIFVVILLVTFAVSGYYRRKARQFGVIHRVQEGGLMLALRVLFAAPLYLSFLVYLLNPDWMAWSMLSLPAWVRWLAALVGLGMLPILVWQMRTIGRNISETVLTKAEHTLVMNGPYRWVRHPLYAIATAIFVALSLVAANWFMLAMALLLVLVVSFVVIPKEEAQLVLKFGDAYRAYHQRTGRLFPRLNWRH
jgi:protein-S-isoprenylcysteine O-methyltransferase Ste14